MYYEIHHTVAVRSYPDEETQHRLAEFLSNQDWGSIRPMKSTMICVPIVNGVEYHLMTSYVVKTSEHSAIRQAGEHARCLSGSRFDVLRTKVEASSPVLLPIYVETHLPIPDEDLQKLEFLTEELKSDTPGSLLLGSRNVRHDEHSLTLRAATSTTFSCSLLRLIPAMNRLGFKPLVDNIEVEYVVWDSNLSIDDAWVSTAKVIR